MLHLDFSQCHIEIEFEKKSDTVNEWMNKEEEEEVTDEVCWSCAQNTFKERRKAVQQHFLKHAHTHIHLNPKKMIRYLNFRFISIVLLSLYILLSIFVFNNGKRNLIWKSDIRVGKQLLSMLCMYIQVVCWKYFEIRWWWFYTRK